MAWVRVRSLVGLLMAAACAPVVAQYPSWEPTSPMVHVVRDRRLALADLAVSRQYWDALNSTTYSYLRANQVASDEVEFTFLVVNDSQVVERALLTSHPGKQGLGDRMARSDGEPPRVVWREQGRELGSHDRGAPVLTLEQLYDVCRDRVLSKHPELVPRLSFHADGLLQHCGFAADDCPDCPTVSMQAVGHSTPQPWQSPSDIVCPDRFGLFVAGQSPLGGFPCEICRCEATNRTDPNPPPPAPPALTPEELELCRLEDRECPQGPEGVQDICKIDPAACPLGELVPNRGNWICMYLAMADCGGFGWSPTPACTALPRPTSASDPAWRERCRPSR